ncbi:TIP41-like protein [Tanacetum coccineum]|uniref:TIP41-like protein n=1 Tax=Tanacetum coccineum TaxID=301880 RepID=A0ABQ5G7Y7_9ASTR
MEWEADSKEIKAAGAELLPDGRKGLRIHGWEIESSNRSCLTSLNLQSVGDGELIMKLFELKTLELLSSLLETVLVEPCYVLVTLVREILMLLLSANGATWEEKLQTSHLPEMIFGDSSLILKHISSGTQVHFNAYDALVGWKKEALPPVEVPAAAQWKFRSKPFEQIILDYDYTFTTPYAGSESLETSGEADSEGDKFLEWEESEEQINVAALTSKEPILFYDEVVLYEDELADNGVSLLTVKVRVMPSCWFLLLRFWLRVDGVLMRLRDTRVLCTFSESAKPVIVRDICWREATFKALASKGYPSDNASYNDPNVISQRLPVVLHKTQKLKVP